MDQPTTLFGTTLCARFATTLHTPGQCGRRGSWINRGIALLIVLNALAVALESVPEISEQWHTAFRWFERVSMALLAIEYASRVGSVVERKGFEAPLSGRLRYMLRPFPLIDLISLATFATPFDLRALRTLRLFRLLHVLGLDRYERPLRSIRIAIRRRVDILVIGVVLMLMLLFFSGMLLHFVEHAAQPKAFSSISAAFWWAVVTLTTTGYGDRVPITLLGKILAGVVLLFGVGIFTIPTAVIIVAILDVDTQEEVVHLEDGGES